MACRGPEDITSFLFDMDFINHGVKLAYFPAGVQLYYSLVAERMLQNLHWWS